MAAPLGGLKGAIFETVTPLVVRAPGRVNLIGEHTDYNNGFVLPVAIDLGINIDFEPTTTRRIELTLAADGRRASVDLDAIGRPTGDWTDYVAGTAWALTAAGASLSGFRGTLRTDLPIGAGLSSSAALELAIAWALARGAEPLGDRLAAARAAQRAENEFVGVASGLMDQYAVAFGEAGRALLLDCRAVTHRAIDLPVDLALVVIDSGVQRRLAASGYGDRHAACMRAVAQIRQVAPGVSSLREVTPALLEDARAWMDPEAFRRARHVVTENDRVLAAAEALEAGDLEALGRLFAASQASMRDDFEMSTPEIDRLVDLALSVDGVVAARLTGGGFGGSTINLVAEASLAEVEAAVRSGYHAPAGRSAAVRRVIASDGVRPVATS
jgi:galactokinase